MSCEKYREMISAQLDNELDQSEIADLKEHIDVCSDCRQFRTELARLGAVGKPSKMTRMPGQVEKDIFKNTIGSKKHTKSIFDFLIGYYRIPRGLVWAGMLAGLLLIGNTIIELNLFESKTGIANTKAAGQDEIVKKVVLSDDDIVSSSVLLKATDEG
jgi:hypothetical protein